MACGVVPHDAGPPDDSPTCGKGESAEVLADDFKCWRNTDFPRSRPRSRYLHPTDPVRHMTCTPTTKLSHIDNPALSRQHFRTPSLFRYPVVLSPTHANLPSNGRVQRYSHHCHLRRLVLVVHVFKLLVDLLRQSLYRHLDNGGRLGCRCQSLCFSFSSGVLGILVSPKCEKGVWDDSIESTKAAWVHHATHTNERCTKTGQLLQARTELCDVFPLCCELELNRPRFFGCFVLSFFMSRSIACSSARSLFFAVFAIFFSIGGSCSRAESLSDEPNFVQIGCTGGVVESISSGGGRLRGDRRGEDEGSAISATFNLASCVREPDGVREPCRRAVASARFGSYL